jgi:hypothetical protein
MSAPITNIKRDSVRDLLGAVKNLSSELKHLDCSCSFKERESGHLIDCNVPQIRAALSDLKVIVNRTVSLGNCQKCGKETVAWGKRKSKWCSNSCRVTAFQKQERARKKKGYL